MVLFTLKDLLGNRPIKYFTSFILRHQFHFFCPLDTRIEVLPSPLSDKRHGHVPCPQPPAAHIGLHRRNPQLCVPLADKNSLTFIWTK